MKMKKMITTNKKFIIKTEDSFGEKTFEIVKGIYEINSFANYRKYSYLSKYGDCEIIFTDNSLTITRKGIFNHTFEVFFDGKKSKFIYETEMFKEEFYSLGNSFSFNDEKCIFSFSYKLLDLNCSEVNEINISIKEV